MYERRRLPRPNLETQQSMKAEDKVRTTLRVRQVGEELREHGARAPRRARASLFRRCKTYNIFLSLHTFSVKQLEILVEGAP